MGKKRYCNECAFFKYEDAEGYGWCELLEEADVNCKDEACVEFEESEIKDIDYEWSGFYEAFKRCRFWTSWSDIGIDEAEERA